MRDIQTRGRDLDNVLFQYQKFVKPAFDEFIFPVKYFFICFINLPFFLDKKICRFNYSKRIWEYCCNRINLSTHSKQIGWQRNYFKKSSSNGRNGTLNINEGTMKILKIHSISMQVKEIFIIVDNLWSNCHLIQLIY